MHVYKKQNKTKNNLSKKKLIPLSSKEFYNELIKQTLHNQDVGVPILC